MPPEERMEVLNTLREYLKQLEGGKPTCKAEAVKNNDDAWSFKPLSRQSCFSTRDGLIPFGCKPYIFAKQIESEEEQP